MAFLKFPKPKGPPPLLLATAMVVGSLAALVYKHDDIIFLGLNALNVILILAVIVLGKPFVPRPQQSLGLVSTLLLTLALYGFFRGFQNIPPYVLQIFEFFPGLLFYYAYRTLQVFHTFRTALDYANGLVPDDQLDFAEAARTDYKKTPGALLTAATIYKTIAEDGLLRAPAVKPYHIIAMQRLGQMMIFNEAQGVSGEGEWYAKKANELSKKLLKYSDTPPTVH